MNLGFKQPLQLVSCYRWRFFSPSSCSSKYSFSQTCRNHAWRVQTLMGWLLFKPCRRSENHLQRRLQRCHAGPQPSGIVRQVYVWGRLHRLVENLVIANTSESIWCCMHSRLSSSKERLVKRTEPTKRNLPNSIKHKIFFLGSDATKLIMRDVACICHRFETRDVFPPISASLHWIAKRSATPAVTWAANCSSLTSESILGSSRMRWACSGET